MTAAQPVFVTPRSREVVWLSGARLFPGAPTVAVSGRAASVVAQSPTDVAVRLPNLPEPGWHQITLRNSSGETSLERGIGVLPMLFTDRGPAANIPFTVVFKGTRGDTILWVVGRSPAPLFQFGSYLHGLEVGLATGKVLPAMAISSNSGELRIALPAGPLQSPLYVQGLFLTSNPGYTPGSFSNVLQL